MQLYQEMLNVQPLGGVVWRGVEGWCFEFGLKEASGRDENGWDGFSLMYEDEILLLNMLKIPLVNVVDRQRFTGIPQNLTN